MIVLLATQTNNLWGVLLGLITAMLTAVVIIVLKWGWSQLQKNLNEGRSELVAQNQAILEQTTKTNGTVARHQMDIDELKSEAKVTKAMMKLLTDLYLKQQPDRGE